MTAAPDQAEALKLAPQVRAIQSAFNDNRASDVRLDQYYTRQDVAAHFYEIFRKHFDPTLYQMIEPSAGTGSFYKLLQSTFWKKRQLGRPLCQPCGPPNERDRDRTDPAKDVSEGLD
jgi:hypothetical protein